LLTYPEADLTYCFYFWI